MADNVTVKGGSSGTAIQVATVQLPDGTHAQKMVALRGTYPDGKLLFDDNFDSGFCGWTELMDSTTPRSPLSLTGFPALTGQHSLRLGTGATGNSTKNGYSMAIKRLTRIHNTGVVSFDVWWAWGSELAPNAPQDITFGIDTQKRDGSARSFLKFRWANIDSSSGLRVKQWRIKRDAGTYVDVPGAIYEHTFNENKQNFHYCKFTVDLAAGYQTLQVYDDVYDVSGLGAGTGAESTVANFNNGLNFAVEMQNRGSSNLCQAWVVLDRVRGWYA